MICLSINYQLVKKMSIYYSFEIWIFCDIFIQNSCCWGGSCSLKIAMTIYAAIFWFILGRMYLMKIFFSWNYYTLLMIFNGLDVAEKSSLYFSCSLTPWFNVLIKICALKKLLYMYWLIGYQYHIYAWLFF